MSGAKPARLLEGRIARLLSVGTAASVGIIAVGVVLMALTGHTPLDVAPAFDPGSLVGSLLGLDPAGFLWLGVVVVLATPLARVVLALAGFLRAGEHEMALVAALIVAVIAVGVVVGINTGPTRG